MTLGDINNISSDSFVNTEKSATTKPDTGNNVNIRISSALPIEDTSWRRQLYYWVGQLTLDQQISQLVWRGKWLGYFTVLPSAEQMQNSANIFEYFSPKINLESEIASRDKPSSPVSGPFTGFYMMDNSGNGIPEKFTDVCCELDFKEIVGTSPLRYSVVGNGDTEFGPFVMEGTYESDTGKLMISRRYIVNTDPLAGKSISHLSSLHGKNVLIPWAAVAVVDTIRSSYGGVISPHLMTENIASNS